MSAAARALGVTQPTVSGQIRALEQRCGGELLDRSGPLLRLTPLGEKVFTYADEIFELGEELRARLAGASPDRDRRLGVGIVDTVPKQLARDFIRPGLSLSEGFFLHATEGPLERLISRLEVHELDVVLSDAPLPPHLQARVRNHLLATSTVGVFAVPELAASLAHGFPGTLHGAPLLLPTRETMLRRSLEAWLGARGLEPRPVAEFADSALQETFAEAGLGALVAPVAIAEELGRARGLRLVHPLEGIEERYYAIMMDRRTAHPGALAIARVPPGPAAADREGARPGRRRVGTPAAAARASLPRAVEAAPG